jgi:hypothetical protein
MIHSLHMDHVKFCGQQVQQQQGTPEQVAVLLDAYWYALCTADYHRYPRSSDCAIMKRMAKGLDPTAIVDLWFHGLLMDPFKVGVVGPRPAQDGNVPSKATVDPSKSSNGAQRPGRLVHVGGELPSK